MDARKAYRAHQLSVIMAEVQGFIDDGYIIQNKYIGLTWWFWRIKHHSNGSEVTIEGLPDFNTFKIIRDGRQVKTGAILTKQQQKEKSS